MTRKSQEKGKPPFKPFDVSTKQLVEIDPQAWLQYVGLPMAQVQIVDADLSTITPEADKILRVEAEKPYLLNLEPQSSYDGDLPERSLFYSILARHRMGLPVKTAVLLLRPEADGPKMTGLVQDVWEGDEADFGLEYRYRVIRVWQHSAERLLEGALATLPLAPLTEEARGQLPAVIERMQARIRDEASPRLQSELWAATYLLMGLRYEADVTEQVLKGVHGMEESTTYQLLIARGEAKGEARGRAEGKAEGKTEGKMEEARTIVLRIGKKRFGEPDADMRVVLAAASVERLEQMVDRLLEVESWQELLA